MLELQSFVDQCQQSSHQAFENFTILLCLLEDKETRKAARLFLTKLVRFIQERFPGNGEEARNRVHFTFSSLDISQSQDQSDFLTLLHFPSTFTPEEWSFTFFEGLSRYKTTDFQNKNLVELGCGIGWITVAIAKKFGPRKVFGLDLNPRAVVCSKINLYLNALDDHANEVKDDFNNENLLDKIEFLESDLLACFMAQKSTCFDVIFGCIPQVLYPTTFSHHELANSDKIDDLLYSYSNYCAKHGYYEDIFGLGLIVKAVEQSIHLIKPGGKLILNLGGRPGQQILQRSFQRRGFNVKEIWQKKVIQAGDTEISQMIDVEEKLSIKFEFFMGPNSDEPMSAKTAKYYADAGGVIHHALVVYELTLENSEAMKALFGSSDDVDYRNALSELDLCFDDKNAVAEKKSFLAALTRKLNTMSFFPYGETQGELVFRKRLAQFLNSYFHTSFTPKHLLIIPNGKWLISNIAHIYSASLILADAGHVRHLRKYESEHLTILEVPQSSTLVEELIRRLKPQLVFFSFNETQNSSIECFKSLSATCEQQGTRLFIDLSPYLQLSSCPPSIALLSYLTDNHLPNHVGIICDLVKNQVYLDLEVCFLLTQNENLMKTLSNSAELTYSRIPLISQLYYSELLSELLKFQMVNVRKDCRKATFFDESVGFQSTFANVKSHVQNSFHHPCITDDQLSITENTIRLDCGENELVCPKTLITSIIASFFRRNFTDEETDVAPDIALLLKSRFGIHSSEDLKIHYGSGIAALFSAIIQTCIEKQGTLVFPQGAYGYFYATAKYFNVPIKILPTLEDNLFKITPTDLSDVLVSTPNCWLFLNFPLVNPTGARYTGLEIEKILRLPEISNAVIIIDTVFSGLEFREAIETYQLDRLFSSGQIKYALLGGISKEFAGAGLRFGYLATKTTFISDGVNKYLNSQPHATILNACKRIYSLLNQRDSLLMNTLEEQRRTLESRADQLGKTLTACGWKVLPSQGGLFLIAKPTAYIGKVVKVPFASKQLTFILNGSNIHEAIFYATGALINNDVWTGIEGYCRFVLSVNVDSFEKALLAIRKFYALAI